MLHVLFILAGATPGQVSKRINRAPLNPELVKAANDMLKFAVKQVDYLPGPDEELRDERDYNVNLDEDFMDLMFKRIHTYSHDPDQRDSKACGEINNLLPEIVEKTKNRTMHNTRRNGKRWKYTLPNSIYNGYLDPDDTPFYPEEYKQDLICKLILAWFLNGRRFIYRTLNFRKPIMEDKRYKIGFLFQALRRNNYDQHKLLQAMQGMEAQDDWVNFETTLMMYTKVLRLNVDMNDLISYIRLLHYNQPDPPLKSVWLFRNKYKTKGRLSSLSTSFPVFETTKSVVHYNKRL